MHDIDEALWTPIRAGNEIAAAVRWARFAVQDPGPQIGPTNNFARLVDAEPTRPRRFYSPQKVAQFERILGWQAKYLVGFADQDEDDSKRKLEVFKGWIEVKVYKHVTFEDLAKALNLSRATAYRYLDEVLSIIAKGLTADGIERGRH